MRRLIPGDPATVMVGDGGDAGDPGRDPEDPCVIATHRTTLADMRERVLTGVEVLVLADARRAN
jgi:hypothetical protein